MRGLLPTYYGVANREQDQVEEPTWLRNRCSESDPSLLKLTRPKPASPGSTTQRSLTPARERLAWANRTFLVRAVRFLAIHAGITQYLDCGAGLPTAENTHQIVQRYHPSAEVVYVDNDPVVLAHGNALLADNDSTHMVDADIFEPAQVLGHS